MKQAVETTCSNGRVRGPKVPLFLSRIGLVAQDRSFHPKNANDLVTGYGFGAHVPTVIEACSKEGCDTILFSPWTVKAIKESDLFPPFTEHNTVILGVGEKSSEVFQVWARGNSAPTRVNQTFARSTDSKKEKDLFVKALPERIWGEVALIICGETNILKIPRGSKSAVDPEHILPVLKQRGARIILNPVHTYMRRPEMRHKRSALSRPDRFVVSVWNRGFVKGPDGRIPWQVYHDGKDVSERVRLIDNPVREKFGARVGVLDVK
jgi:hypothetical protein